MNPRYLQQELEIFQIGKSDELTVFTRNIVDSNITSFLSEFDTNQFSESAAANISSVVESRRV